MIKVSVKSCQNRHSIWLLHCRVKTREIFRVARMKNRFAKNKQMDQIAKS
jgi:hypothetical protein